MLNSIFQFIINIYVVMLQNLDKLILTPVIDKFNDWWPGFSDWSGTLTTFLNDYVFKGVAFCREVFFNITGYPRALFLVLLGFLVFRFNLMLVMYGVKALLNLWSLYRAGKAATHSK